MSAARASAARLRGIFVGACSGASAVGAHSLGGGALPESPSIVLLLLGCAVIGAVASSPMQTRHALPVVAVYLSAGQVVGHCTLVLASGHSHGDHWSTAMLVAHLLAAAGGAALICVVERLFGALAGKIWRLFVAMLALLAGDERRPAAPVWMHAGPAARLLVSGGLRTRGPPPLAAP